jgi:hypothetical protein
MGMRVNAKAKDSFLKTPIVQALGPATLDPLAGRRGDRFKRKEKKRRLINYSTKSTNRLQ